MVNGVTTPKKETTQVLNHKFMIKIYRYCVYRSVSVPVFSIGLLLFLFFYSFASYHSPDRSFIIQIYDEMVLKIFMTVWGNIHNLNKTRIF